ncbi:type IV pilus modification protein PilV [Delftia sp. PS-11]|uniref:type IV pilus modification protein PilV n=1 Tax=Delftia sp. PS-11 TaxID=2767222 RepID=UPI0024587DAF|nr:type IV pilus modification protein PilV [Delftia sp. PS-11]KAJ8740875.1 type IV pilus modification protein PilV [Delftia sp. PS-11]
MQLLSRHAPQAGITLIESLIALVIASLAVLGVLGSQLRTLADNQSGVRRAQAIRLIEDFSERTRANPNSLGQISAYVSDWDSATAAPATDCAASACSAAQLAAHNLAHWKASVNQVLPGGKAKVFISEDEATAASGNQRQLGIMISWRENEQSGDASYKTPLGINSAGERGTNATTCPADRTCHLQYIPLSARCAPYFSDSAVQFFCAGG